METLQIVDSVGDSDRLERCYPVLRIDWSDSRVRILGQDEGQPLVLLRDSSEVVRRLRQVWKRNALLRGDDEEAIYPHTTTTKLSRPSPRRQGNRFGTLSHHPFLSERASDTTRAAIDDASNRL